VNILYLFPNSCTCIKYSARELE